MAITLTDVKAYVGADGDDYDALLTDCLAQAVVLVTKYVGSAVVPADVLDLAHLIVTADLFARREAPNGITNQQYATLDGIGQSPVRIARDPLAGAYKVLQRWVLPW